MTEPTTDTPSTTPDIPIGNEPTPLSDMLVANGKLIDYCIESYGASVVAEFFVNVGTSMAVVYDLHADDSGKFVSAPTEEGK